MRVRGRFYASTLVGALLLILPATGARAADTDLDQKADALDRGATTRVERSAIFTKFGVPTTPPYNTLPPGQALILFRLCGTDTACQTQALNDRNAHMGWGQVVTDLKKNNLTTDAKVGDAVRSVTDAHSDLVTKTDKFSKPDRMEKMEKPEKPEKPEKMQRPERPERPGR